MAVKILSGLGPSAPLSVDTDEVLPHRPSSFEWSCGSFGAQLVGSDDAGGHEGREACDDPARHSSIGTEDGMSFNLKKVLVTLARSAESPAQPVEDRSSWLQQALLRTRADSSTGLALLCKEMK